MKQTFSGIQMILAFVAGLLLGILIILSIVGINSLTGKEEKPAAPAEEQVDNPNADIEEEQEEEYPRETLTKERPSREDTRIYSSEQTQPGASRTGNSNRAMTDGVKEVKLPQKDSKTTKETSKDTPKESYKETKKEASKSTRSMKDGYESKSNYNPKSDPCATGGNSWY